MREGSETGTLEGSARCYVVRAGAGGGDCSHCIAFALQFLDQKRRKAALAVARLDFHIHVGVGMVVMECKAAFADWSAIEFKNPVAAAGASFHASHGFRLGSDSTQHRAMAWMSRGFRVAKDDLFAHDVSAVGVRHDDGQNIVALDFETQRLGGCEQGFEEAEGLGAVFGDKVELEQGGAVFPGTGYRYGSKTHGLLIGFQTIGEGPAWAAMDGIVDDLAGHLLPIAGAYREDVFGRDPYGLISSLG